jgi:hypothetical protein
MQLTICVVASACKTCAHLWLKVPYIILTHPYTTPPTTR